MSIVPGDQAPPFVLLDSCGSEVSSEQFKGSNLVIYFYPRDNTPGCTIEACGFRDMHAEILNTGTQVVGISPDSPSSHVKFINKHRLPFPLLSDPDGGVMSQYGAYRDNALRTVKLLRVVRSTVLIDANGIVVRHWEKVKMKDYRNHAAHVLEAIQQIS